ncbi:MAG: hypothetical protein QOF33_278 [Thermomicrobiales bacterium]|jgi:ABC-type proline/glycine betaine transport system permease subunit|nr:hypothetical protein [Thermomicrobiales bacterium]
MMWKLGIWVAAALIGFGAGGAAVAIQPGQNHRLVVTTGLAGAAIAVALVELLRLWWPRS